jgi:hypothetical protein
MYRAATLKEDASQLVFPEDFALSRPLWNAEVDIILQQVLNNLSADGKEEAKSQNQKMIQDSLDYVRKFKSFRNREAITECRKALEQVDVLHEFEVAALNNLNIDDIDEAYCLIPTLKEKFQDREDELKSIIAEMKRFQSLD